MHAVHNFFLFIKVALIVLKEVYRIKCILVGLKLAASLFPNAWFIIIAGGSIRGMFCHF
jgi:hypothetical protein